MGYYIEVPKMKGKAQQIADLYGAEILDKKPSFREVSPDKAIICVIDNWLWEAAGFAYSELELERFAAQDMCGPQRLRTWLLMDKQTAIKLTGFTGY